MPLGSICSRVGGRDPALWEWRGPRFGAHTKFLTAGRFPTEALLRVERENAMLSLEDAHWRLAALPAQLAGVAERGVLNTGAPADIIVYDLENPAILPAEVVHDLSGGEWRRIAA